MLNIAEGARFHSGPDKAKALDYAIGSTLECAACLDSAAIKGCLTQEQSLTEKKRRRRFRSARKPPMGENS